MKLQTLFAATFIALLAAAGCIRTTHEIKPIHITMDINLKIDKALDSAAAAETSKSAWQERKPKIDALKAAGTIGENNTGLLAPVPGATMDAEAFQLITEANADRTKMYASVAEKQNSTPDVVGKRRAVRAAEDAPAGHYIQDGEGNWTKKS